MMMATRPSFLESAETILSCGGEKIYRNRGAYYIVGNPNTARALKRISQTDPSVKLIPYAPQWAIVRILSATSDGQAIAIFDRAQNPL